MKADTGPRCGSFPEDVRGRRGPRGAHPAGSQRAFDGEGCGVQMYGAYEYTAYALYSRYFAECISQQS